MFKNFKKSFHTRVYDLNYTPELMNIWLMNHTKDRKYHLFSLIALNFCAGFVIFGVDSYGAADYWVSNIHFAMFLPIIVSLIGGLFYSRKKLGYKGIIAGLKFRALAHLNWLISIYLLVYRSIMGKYKDNVDSSEWDLFSFGLTSPDWITFFLLTIICIPFMATFFGSAKVFKIKNSKYSRLNFLGSNVLLTKMGRFVFFSKKHLVFLFVGLMYILSLLYARNIIPEEVAYLSYEVTDDLEVSQQTWLTAYSPAAFLVWGFVLINGYAVSVLLYQILFFHKYKPTDIKV